MIAERVHESARIRFLDLYGLRVVLRGDWPEVLDDLFLDFAWFESPPVSEDAVEVEVEVFRRTPDFNGFGEIPAAFVTPRNVVYQDGGRTIIDYFGKALGTFDRNAKRLRIEGEARHLVHEAAYLFLLSRVGEHLDARGLPRLHALGLSGAHGGVALLLPAGGGKSTLGLRALREGVHLLSEDSPLIDRHGRIYPFPLRLGVNESDAASIVEAPVQRIERMEFHPKLVVDIRAFADQIEREPQPLRHIVIGRRSLGHRGSLEPLPRRAAIAPLLREAVVGVGLYQGLEFLLQRGLRDVVGKVGVGATRSGCCAAAVMHARVWRLTIGRDRDANWAALRRLLM